MEWEIRGEMQTDERDLKGERVRDGVGKWREISEQEKLFWRSSSYI